MSDLAVLIERVEKATGPDRELDRAIWAASTGNPIVWAPADTFEPETVVIEERYEAGAPGNPVYTLDPLTASIDAALALKDRMLPGQAAAMGDMAFTGHPRGPWATIWSIYGEPKWNAEAATPALAIVLATLRAVTDAPHIPSIPLTE